MLTKKEFVEIVSERANGGPVTDYRKWHPLVVGKLADTVLNSIIADDVQKWMINGTGGVDSDWVRTVEKIPIKWDLGREQCYIEWKIEILFLQGYGVREIGWPVSGDARTFSILPSSSYSAISDLECSEQDDNQYIAILEGKRVYFPAMSRVMVVQKRTLTAKVVMASASYADNDPVPVPEDRMIEVLDLTDRLLTPMKDKRMKVTNDSNPNTI